MGHATEQTTFLHYRRSVKKAQAEKFWKIESPEEPKERLLLTRGNAGRPAKGSYGRKLGLHRFVPINV